ncbi:putative reverse transcriptase domain-containing protein [Tanacetum coccineum]|uniref:Reverse transcriptase domain-containing protein n=1 Tax=Tanacetum coccineum TaxID=301880 RepID=A0ABQ4ZJ86_9ASTR
MQRGKVENAIAEMLCGLDQLMERKEGGDMYLLWVPLIGDVRTLMMDEAHASRYLVQSRTDKTYYDVRDMYGGHIENAPAEMLRGMDQQMEKKKDGGLYFMDQIWVPLVGDTRTVLMNEAHSTRYSIHSGADKMYYDLRYMFWWPGMKKDIATQL